MLHSRAVPSDEALFKKKCQFGFGISKRIFFVWVTGDGVLRIGAKGNVPHPSLIFRLQSRVEAEIGGAPQLGRLVGGRGGQVLGVGTEFAFQSVAFVSQEATPRAQLSRS